MFGVERSDKDSNYYADSNDDRGKTGRVFCTHEFIYDLIIYNL